MKTPHFRLLIRGSLVRAQEGELPRAKALQKCEAFLFGRGETNIFLHVSSYLQNQTSHQLIELYLCPFPMVQNIERQTQVCLCESIFNSHVLFVAETIPPLFGSKPQ